MTSRINLDVFFPMYYQFNNSKQKSKTLIALLNIVKRLELPYEEVNSEFFIGITESEILKEVLYTRKLYEQNKLELYSAKEASDLLGVTQSTVNRLVKKQELKVKTVISKMSYFGKQEIDKIKKLLNMSYSTQEIVNIVRIETNFSDISRTMVRMYLVKEGQISYFQNPVDKYDLRIDKKDKDRLIQFIQKNYRPVKKQLKNYKNFMVKATGSKEKLCFIEKNQDKTFIDKKALSKYAQEKYPLRSGKMVGKHLIEHVIIICKQANVKWYTNLKFDNIYILKDEISKCIEYYNELNTIITSHYSTTEVKEIFNKREINLVAKYAEAIVIGPTRYFKKNKIEELKFLYKNYIKISDIAKELNLRNSQVSKLAKEIGLKTIDGKGIPYMEANELIVKKDVKAIKEYVVKRNKLNNTNSSYEKYKILISDYLELGRVLPKTVKLYDKFVKQRLNQLKDGSNKIYSNLYINTLSNLKTEIIEYTNKDLTVLIEKMEIESHKKEMAYFINFCKKHTLTKYDADFSLQNYKYNATEPYELQQWFDFGYLLFRREQPLYKIHLEKALENKADAMAWLYCSMHYVCGWRAVDIKKKIPLIPLELILGVSEEQVIEKIKTGNFTDDMAQIVVNFVVNYIKNFRIIPKKTENIDNIPPLKFVVEKNYVYQIGLLIALCEAHRRNGKAKGSKHLNTDYLITDRATIIEVHENFFGEKYKMIFKGEGFYNRRATVTFMGIIQRTSQDYGWGIGYQLSSIFRSHKSGRSGVSNSTQEYLESINKNKDIDQVTNALMERGTFGFIPYLITKMLLGENLTEIDIEKQNKEINEIIPLKPFQIEKIMKSSSLNKNKVISILNELFVTKKEDLLKVLLKLSAGEAPSKMEYAQCLLKCIDIKACVNHNRTDCIGCDYFIPEMYFLLEFKVMLEELITKIKNAKSDFDKIRFSYSLVSVYLPILQQAIKTIGKKRVETFIDVKELKVKIKNLHDNNHLLLG